MVLPLFLFCMIAALQYCQVMDTAVRLAGSLTDTGKMMAAAAYLYEYPEDAQQSPGIAVSALSAAWAHSHVMSRAGDTADIKNANMAMSSFLEDGQMIDLVMTYQIKSPFRIVRLPRYFFLQRANVRAWTGRLAGQNGGSGRWIRICWVRCGTTGEESITPAKDVEEIQAAASISQMKATAITLL